VSIPLGNIAEHGPHYNEDGDRYLLRFPGEKKAKTYTRVTTLVKAADSTFGLEDWKIAMAMLGMAKSAPLRTDVATLLAEFPDPWYDSPESKRRLKALVKRAPDLGGGGERRDTGTALHSLFEGVVRGKYAPDRIGDEWRAHITRATEVLAEFGITLVPELCEVTLYHKGYNAVGRTDFAGMFEGELYVGDLKTGGNTWVPKIDYRTRKQTGWQDGYAINDKTHAGQMYVYASADNLVEWPADKWDECTLHPAPAYNQERGFILHMPSTEDAQVSIRWVDLKKGKEWVQTCEKVRKARNLKPLIERLGAVEPPMPENGTPAPEVDIDELLAEVNGEAPPLREEEHEAALAAEPSFLDRVTVSNDAAKLVTPAEVAAAVPNPAVDPVAVAEMVNTLAAAPETVLDDAEAIVAAKKGPLDFSKVSLEPCAPERRAWIIARVKTLGDSGYTSQLVAAWPSMVPTLRQEGHTEADVDLLARMCDGIEDEYRVPFFMPDPATAKVEPEPEPAAPRVLPELPDEIGPAPYDEVAAMLTTFAAYPEDVKTIILGWSTDASLVEKGFSLRLASTLRRLAIYRTIDFLVRAEFVADDEAVRSLIFHATGDRFVLDAHTTVGVELARLDPKACSIIDQVCAASLQGRATATVDPDLGVVRWTITEPAPVKFKPVPPPAPPAPVAPPLASLI